MAIQPFTAKILPPNRPTRIFESNREERAKLRKEFAATTMAKEEISRTIRSPADQEAIKQAQLKREEEQRLAAEK